MKCYEVRPNENIVIALEVVVEKWTNEKGGKVLVPIEPGAGSRFKFLHENPRWLMACIVLNRLDSGSMHARRVVDLAFVAMPFI